MYLKNFVYSKFIKIANLNNMNNKYVLILYPQ